MTCKAGGSAVCKRSGLQLTRSCVLKATSPTLRRVPSNLGRWHFARAAEQAAVDAPRQGQSALAEEVHRWLGGKAPMHIAPAAWTGLIGCRARRHSRHWTSSES